MNSRSSISSVPFDLYWKFATKFPGLFRKVSDKKHLRILYKSQFGKYPNLENPQSYNEKIQWLKLHDRKSWYPVVVDKMRAKGWASERIGSEYIVPTYQSWASAWDIDISHLPDRFVLKTNHDCGGVVICHDKTSFDLGRARKFLGKHLNHDYYLLRREWPYSQVKRCVFAEEYIEPDSCDDGDDLPDYKVLCFGGKARFIELHSGRMRKRAHTQDLYTPDWQLLPIVWDMPMSGRVSKRPDRLDEMLTCSETLSRDFEHVRIDWFESGGHLLLGEITLYDGAGFSPFENQQDDLDFGALIDLSKVTADC